MEISILYIVTLIYKHIHVYIDYINIQTPTYNYYKVIVVKNSFNNFEQLLHFFII